MSTQKVVRFLGWFSLGLGAVEVVAPHAFTRAFYTRNRKGLVRTVYGLREIAAGIGLLTQRDPTPWVWARVTGDAVDLATLASALKANKPKEKLRNIVLALASVAGITVVDVLTGLKLRRSE